MFISDFDGTLLTDDKTISTQDIQTLDVLGQKKVVRVIATGRSVYSFNKALEKIKMAHGQGGLPVDYVIFCTGAGIMAFPSGRVMYQRDIPRSGVDEITAYFDRQQFDYMVHRAIPQTRYFYYKSHQNHNPDFQSRIMLYQDYARPVTGDLNHFDAATEVLAILPGKTDMDTVDAIRSNLPDFSVIPATSPLDHQSSWIEVFHADVSKSKAASWLSGQLGIDRQQTVSVGNDYNDQDLLAWTGKGFAVDNSPAMLKQAFQTVRSNNQSGMTDAVRVSGLMA